MDTLILCPKCANKQGLEAYPVTDALARYRVVVPTEDSMAGVVYFCPQCAGTVLVQGEHRCDLDSIHIVMNNGRRVPRTTVLHWVEPLSAYVGHAPVSGGTVLLAVGRDDQGWWNWIGGDLPRVLPREYVDEPMFLFHRICDAISPDGIPERIAHPPVA